jgi:hypothetical protein
MMLVKCKQLKNTTQKSQVMYSINHTKQNSAIESSGRWVFQLSVVDVFTLFLLPNTTETTAGYKGKWFSVMCPV